MMALDMISPIGGERLDLLTAQICHALDRCLIARKKGSKPPQIEDFILKYGPASTVADTTPEKPKRQTQKDMLGMVVLLNEMFGGKDLRNVKRS